jgi:Ca2+-binding RTX toxin-like protein
MQGSGLREVLRGSGGNDELYGGGGSDDLFGDAGNDILVGELGNDALHGGDRNDILVPGVDGDDIHYLNGGAGIDTADYSPYNGKAVVNLSAEGASFPGTLAADALENIEIVFTGGGSDELIGNALGNGLSGGGGNDIIKGNRGNDILLGRDGHDDLFGHAGDDDLEGGEGVDHLDGGANRDVLLGGADGDILFGGSEGDTLNGGDDDDDLFGGSSPDRLTGGLGRDDFIYTKVSDSKPGSFRDTILDFKRGQDDIDLRAIDADTSKNSGNDKFKFIGKDAFKGGGGELRYKDHGSTCTAQADVNGDKDVDFEIKVNVGSLSSSDFLL